MAEKAEGMAPHATAGQTAGPLNAGRVSSPASTGGAGTFFEQHVDAYWLAQLLVRGIPPILRDCAVVEVHLQTALGTAGSWPAKSSGRSPSARLMTSARRQCRISGRISRTLSSFR
jgi:hypothetical protein